MQEKIDYKKRIADNISFLMDYREISRKELCEQLDIKYTTLCDWLKGRTYPRIDALEQLAGYFCLDLPDLFMDIPQNEKLTSRLKAYAGGIAMEKDYSSTYPADFWDLFGSGADLGIEEPEDLPAEEVEINL